jgi:uridine kinase
MSADARTCVELALARTPTLGAGRLLCLDGPAGSGKSTLARAVFEIFPGCRVVTMDDLYDGWAGLPHVEDQLATLLLPLAGDRPGSYRRYDWPSARFAETVTVDPVDLLVLEGVGSGSERFASLATVLVWLEAPETVRLDRGLARDGSSYEPQWRQWMLDEAAHFAAQRTRERADLVVRTG